MEATAASTGSLLLFSSPRRSSHGFRSPLVLPLLPCNSYSTSGGKQRRLICLAVTGINSRRSSRSSTLRLRCSPSVTDGQTAVVSSERWLLEPAGDGDWRHIGYKVARLGAIEIASDVVTVGRVADKADIVLPVATVSGLHARLEKKDRSLVVTDLDSTNGTYINERRLVPGFPVPIDPGSLLIFGDVHLAMFRVTKMIVEVPSDTDAAKQETETDVVSAAVEDTTR